MYPMMATTGWNYGFITLWGLHILSVIAFYTGVLFFIILAIKTFTPTQLKNWAIWLIVVGSLLCLFTIAIIGRPWVGMWYLGSGGMQGAQMMQMGQMMERMMEHDRGSAGADHNDHDEMENMMRMMMRGMGGPDAGAMFGEGSQMSATQDEHNESSSSMLP